MFEIITKFLLARLDIESPGRKRLGPGIYRLSKGFNEMEVRVDLGSSADPPSLVTFTDSAKRPWSPALKQESTAS